MHLTTLHQFQWLLHSGRAHNFMYSKSNSQGKEEEEEEEEKGEGGEEGEEKKKK